MSSVTNKEIKVAMTPWDKVERQFTDDPNWYQRTEQEWLDHNRKVKEDILNIIGNTRDVRSPRVAGAIERLVDREGYEKQEAIRAVKKLINNKSKPLQQVLVGVPHANADEKLSALVLKLQGFDNVSLSNHNPVTGTDLKGSRGYIDITEDPFDEFIYSEGLDKDPYYADQLNEYIYHKHLEKGGDPKKIPQYYQIDAQTRLSPQKSLNLGVMGNIPNDNAVNLWKRAPGSMLFRDLLMEMRSQAIKDTKGYVKRFAGQNDKLLETNNFIFNQDEEYPIDWMGDRDSFDKDKFRNNPNDPYNGQWDDHQKDYLITSERPNAGSQLVSNAGPYNPTLPDDWAMLDLSSMRDDLIGTRTMSEIRDLGIEPNRRASRNGSLRIVIPKKNFDRWDEDINPIVREILTRKRGRR